MKQIILSLLTLASLGLAPAKASPAQDERVERLSPEHRKWLEEEVVYIILDLEKDVFLSLETVEERDSFIEAFWRKRDPNPATPVNEYKEEHYKRLEYANKFLGRGTFLPGWKTDQGRMYILLGEPLEIQRFEGRREIREAQLWFYSGDPAKGLPAYFYLLFFKRYNVGSYELYHPMTDGPGALLNGVANIEAKEAFQILEQASPELARASLRLVTTDPIDWENATPSLGSEMLFAEITESPKRAVVPDYADAWLHYGNRVSTEYSFNFIPSRSYFAVLEGADGTQFVSYSVEIDPQYFTMETDADETKFYTTLDVTTEAMNEEGVVVLSAEREDYLELNPGQFQAVRASPLSYQANFPLLAGKYKVSVILRNRVTKQYTVAEADLSVGSDTTPSFSDVVLGYSVETLRGAGAPEPDEVRTFQLGSVQVFPAAGNVFTLDETAHVFLQVLGASADSRLHFQLLDEMDEVLEERETALASYRGGPVVEPFPLRGMVGGTYRFRIRLMDSAGRVVTEQTVPCQISPRASIARPWIRRASFGARTPGLLALARGDQFLALERVPEAEAEFERAMAAAGADFPVARWKLASIALRTGDPKRALELLTPIEQEFPNQYDVVAGLGLGYSLEGDCVKGVGYLEHAKTLRPPDTALLNVLGNCYAELGDHEKAAEAFQSSLDLNPDQDPVRERLSSVRQDDD